MSREKSWEFHEQWRISGHLTTTDNLHIGSGETVFHPELEADKKPVELNGVVTDIDDHPYIPGSTLKGNLCACLRQRLNSSAAGLMDMVFGRGTETGNSKKQNQEQDNGQGGRAEFLDIHLSSPVDDESLPLPYWNATRQNTTRQVFVETSVAIDRVTRTALDKKLIHRQMVPPGVTFAVTICGSMKEDAVALLLAALECFNDQNDPVTLGANTANGCGRMGWHLTALEKFGEQEAAAWFVDKKKPMLAQAMLKVEKQERDRLFANGRKYLRPATAPDNLSLTLSFDGPFLVDDPPTKTERKNKTSKAEEDHSKLPPDHKPLRDAKKRPRLPEKSIRGGLRSQAERIARTIGVHCCDSRNPCSPVFKVDQVEQNLCPICQLFGAPGWKSPLSITDFKCISGKHELIRQDFVAIDRFTGGAKPTAKFDADYVYAPKFKGNIALDTTRMRNDTVTAVAKGLLVLVLRDLCDGDITLGFGRAKGYGSCRAENVDLSILSPETTIRKFLDANNVDSASTMPTTADVGSNSPAPVHVSPAHPQVQHNLFHNPYHFVPVKNPTVTGWLPKEKLDPTAEPGLHTHDRYHSQQDGKSVYNGRILCRLETRTPMFIGGKRMLTPKNEPQEIAPFRLNGDCAIPEYAIPATSLRGMLSSIVETASCSSLRVLEDKFLSRRMTMKESLPAMGMLLHTGTPPVLRLLPLVLPSLECEKDGSLRNPVPEKWRDIFNVPGLKVYVDGYKPSNNKPDYIRGSYLDQERPDSFSATSGNFCYMKIGKKHWRTNQGQDWLEVEAPRIKTIKTHRGDVYHLLGQQTTGENWPLSQQEFEGLSEQEQKQYTKGVLRVLGIDGRENDIPTTKHHEIFLPLPAGCMKNRQLDIRDALTRFNRIADERAGMDKKNKYPFEPKGRKRDTINKGKADELSTIRLQNRDIVFFDIDKQGKVTDLAISSIWRKEIPGTIFDYFKSLGNDADELLPFNPDRKRISPAELLFGFVEDRKKKQDTTTEEQETDQEPALSFAGKVRISFGRLAAGAGQGKEILADPVTLKALATPKVPSPALYFKNKQGGYVPKNKLYPSPATQPQGRKFYLHCFQQNGEIVQLDQNGYPVIPGNNHSLYPWESKSNLPNQGDDPRANLKVKVTPVKSGTAFYFHLDFDNLSKEELSLLCYSLRPDEQFQHKLGMGKPIGLGSVRIEPVGLFLLDRQGRYSKTTEGTRYNGGVWQSSSVKPEEYPPGYDLERVTGEQSIQAPDPYALAVDYADTMDAEIRTGISLLGNPAKVVAPVHYPQVLGKDIEDENFKWFVANDSGTGRGRNRLDAQQDNLKPLQEGNSPLPLLKRHEWREK